MSEWQPIETAPRDGQSVLCYVDLDNMYRIITLRWDVPSDGNEAKWRTDVHSFVDFEPTHWMPLPEPPKAD